MEEKFDGFYVGYFTGSDGNSIGMFVFMKGIVTGADAGGGRYDGSYLWRPDRSRIVVDIQFRHSIGNQLITKATAESSPVAVEMTLELPADFNRHDVHRIETPFGPINAKFEKIRGL